MKEIVGNLWDYYDEGNWVVITVNSNVKKSGEAVMGVGIAKQAKNRYPTIARKLAELIQTYGSKVQVIESFQDGRGLIAFPTKRNWYDNSSLELIKISAYQLAKLTPNNKKVYLPRPGCGSGGLIWAEVKPAIETILDNRFIVVSKT